MAAQKCPGARHGVRGKETPALHLTIPSAGRVAVPTDLYCLPGTHISLLAYKGCDFSGLALTALSLSVPRRPTSTSRLFPRSRLSRLG